MIIFVCSSFPFCKSVIEYAQYKPCGTAALLADNGGLLMQMADAGFAVV